jgi:hypothetical protein
LQSLKTAEGGYHLDRLEEREAKMEELQSGSQQVLDVTVIEILQDERENNPSYFC